MVSDRTDSNRALMLDGNSAAGLLWEIFGRETTASPIACAHCGREGALGSLLSFGQAMGTVLRCPACESVLLRIVEAPGALYLDMRGATHVRLERPASE
jgi:hypothetical protein